MADYGRISSALGPGISAMLRTCRSHCIGDASRALTPQSTERSCQPKSGYRFNYDGSVTQVGECSVVGLSFHLRSSVDALEISSCQFIYRPIS